MHFDLAQASWIGFVGGVYEIVGALVLGRGLFASAATIGLQASSAWGYNPRLLRMFAEQRYDAFVGAFFLCGGFGLQALAAAGDRTDFVPIPLAALAALAVGLGFYFALRMATVRRFFIQAYNSLPVTQRNPEALKNMLKNAFNEESGPNP